MLSDLFLGIIFLTLVASGSSQLGNCSTSPIRSADNNPNYITCHAKVKYDIRGRQGKVNGHVTASTCDPGNVCQQLRGSLQSEGATNIRCEQGFCCRDGKKCSGISGNASVLSGVLIVLILSTLASVFAM